MFRTGTVRSLRAVVSLSRRNWKRSARLGRATRMGVRGSSSLFCRPHLSGCNPSLTRLADVPLPFSRSRESRLPSGRVSQQQRRQLPTNVIVRDVRLAIRTGSRSVGVWCEGVARVTVESICGNSRWEMLCLCEPECVDDCSGNHLLPDRGIAAFVGRCGDRRI